MRKKVSSLNDLEWRFSNGTCVMAETFEQAVKELEKVSTKNFWASETSDNTWDVQLSDKVLISNIVANSVIESVRIARWKSHLDKTFKRMV